MKYFLGFAGLPDGGLSTFLLMLVLQCKCGVPQARICAENKYVC